MRELIILGCTGSIGTQILKTIKNKDFKVRSIAVGRNIEKAKEIIKEFDIEYISVLKKDDAQKLQKEFPNLLVSYGDEGLIKAVNDYPGDVCNAITGIAGLLPTIEALKNKKNVYLANKETLVVAGELILSLAKENNVKIIPIDSEHNAIYRLLENKKKEEISKVIITASGGAFRDKSLDELKNVTIKEALNHPNWNMGAKITVDCATMVNKGLEVMEAHYLFDLDYDKIETVIHPESIIHSMVEYTDNSIGALMYNPSMLIPIQYAILGDRQKTEIKPIDFLKLEKLSFRKMDEERFPMIKLAYYVGRKGGLLPTVFNASNEAAVNLFLNGKIKFLQIEEIITKAVKNFELDNEIETKELTLESILTTDKMIKANILF